MERVGKERVRKLMALHGIRARHKRKYIATTNSNHDLPVAPNLLQRDFSPAAPNQVWTSDITHVATAEGWLYLVVIIDLFSRQEVGWSMQPHMKAELVTDALRMAWFRRRPEAGVIVHTDRGSQYCSHLFQDALKAYGMRSSMSRRGDCWDNAPTESLWGSLKSLACTVASSLPAASTHHPLFPLTTPCCLPALPVPSKHQSDSHTHGRGQGILI